jgi:thioredoxin-like negative regulator of GroEL
MGAEKFNDAAVAYLKALQQRPDDPAALQGRADALLAAGKAEAARELLNKP